MTLRKKLLLAQLPIILALIVVAAGALYAAVRFGAAPGAILSENFLSFDVAHGMLQALDEIDQRALSATLQGEQFTAADVSERAASFERELRVQEGNITEPGEDQATADLRHAWDEYHAGLDGVGDPTAFAAHRERSQTLRKAIDVILQINRDAMHRKSELAQAQAERIGYGLIGTAVIALCLALVISGVWLRSVIAPIRVLQRAVQRMSEGDFAAKIQVGGTDELALLSAAFNNMAEHLMQYRQSSLGGLLEANSRLESVMDSLTDAVIVYDLGGAPVAYNEVATRWLGLDRVGLDSLPESLQDVVRDAFERVRQSGEPHEPASLEAAVEVAEGLAPRWVLVSATPVRARQDVVSGVTVALRDVTRSRRIEGFKGDLVAAAAHELKTPLTSLHMAVHLCLEQAAGPLTDRQQDLLATARLDCERLQSVVEELLEMARLESGAAHLVRVPVNVGELVRDTAARHQTQARRVDKTLEAIQGDSLLTIQADGGRLRNVLDNLLENAFLHTGERGRVAIGFTRTNGAVRIFVDDDGPGVPEEFRQRVFAKFFRVPGTTKQGSGLGLSIVQDIVRAHGGEVGVESSPWGGARFWVAIPVTPSHGANGANGANG
jgi:NtrC-family two-component system sensor histidine kinase KinB